MGQKYLGDKWKSISQKATMIGKISKIEAEGDLLVIEAGIKAGIILIDHQKEILEIDLRDALTVEKKGILLKIVQNVFFL